MGDNSEKNIKCVLYYPLRLRLQKVLQDVFKPDHVTL